MSDLRSVSKKFITEFIQMYKNFPCLWKIKSKEYGDRVLKRLAYEVLAGKLSEVMPRCTKETVVKKIDSLRGNFRKEYRKVKSAEKSGLKYVPTLWYYEKLIFLKSANHEVAPPIEEKEKGERKKGEKQNVEEFLPEFIIKSELVEYDPIDSVVDIFSEPSMSNQSSTNLSASTSDTTGRIATGQRRKQEESDAMEYDDDNGTFPTYTQNRRVDNDMRYERAAVEDELDVVGRNFVYKLRTLPKTVRIVTEKLMSDILFEAKQGNVDRNTTVTINNTM